MRSRIPALLAAGGLALVTTACGGGADEAPSEKKDEQKQEAAAKPRDIFALLGSKTADMTNYRIDIEMTVEDDELEGTFRPTFTYQVQDDPKSVLAEIDMGDEYRDVVAEEMGEFLTGVDPEALSTFTILKADDEVYLKNPHGIHGDADWVTVASKKDLEEMPDIDFQAFVVLTEVLAGAEDVADDGTEEINGQETTKFAGSLTQKDIDAVDDAEKSAALEEFFDEKIADKVDFEVWADADSVPHRITMKEGDDEMKLEFSDFGKVSFDLPADDEIGEMEA